MSTESPFLRRMRALEVESLRDAVRDLMLPAWVEDPLLAALANCTELPADDDFVPTANPDTDPDLHTLQTRQHASIGQALDALYHSASLRDFRITEPHSVEALLAGARGRPYTGESVCLEAWKGAHLELHLYDCGDDGDEGLLEVEVVTKRLSNRPGPAPVTTDQLRNIAKQLVELCDRADAARLQEVARG